MRDRFVYGVIRCGAFVVSFLPYSLLHRLGKFAGSVGYFICKKYRKRTLNHLALAKDLPLTSKQRKKVAIESFQNLMITLLEFARLSRRPEEFSKRAKGVNTEVFEEAKAMGKGVVLLSSHQANWEIGVFDVISGCEGVTIARPLKNKHLYRFVEKIRARSGNRLISPKNALNKGIAELNKGNLFAFIGDQAKVLSDYHYPFLGTRAWTAATPALVAYRTGSPLCVISKKRVGLNYVHHYSPLIWPDRNKPWREEVKQMMDQALSVVEQSIKEAPGQWLWQHRRWKQGMVKMKKKYRYDFILVLLPEKIPQVLHKLKEHYPRAFFTYRVSEECLDAFPYSDGDVIPYKTTKDLFVNDWSYQMVLDFIGVKGIKKHFKQRGAFEVIDYEKRRP